MRRIIKTLAIITLTLLTALPAIGLVKTYAKTITVYKQTDSEWASYPYGYSNTAGTVQATIGSAGCGLLSYTNAVYYLNGSFIPPKTLADYSVKNGYRVNGVGTSYGLYKSFADNRGSTYGIAYVGNVTTYAKLKENLQKGYVAICGKSGHIMCIVDYDSSNSKYLLLDSYPSSNRGTSSGYAWKTEAQLKSLELYYSFYIIKSTIIAPTITSAKGVSSSSIEIKWNQVSGAAKYRIDQRMAGTESYETLKTVSSSVTSYTSTGLNPGKRYWYRVYAINDSGTSDSSVSTEACTLCDTPAVTSAVALSSSSIKIQWNSVARAQKYIIGRKIPDGGVAPYEVAATVDSSVTSYTDTGLKAGTSYKYRVLAVNEKDQASEFINERTRTLATQTPVEGVSLSQTAVSRFEGDIYQLTASVSPSAATDKSVTWSSSDTAVAAVDSSGKVTAVKEGTAVITVRTTDGGKTASCSVTVKAATPIVLTGKAQVADGTYFIRRYNTDFALSVQDSSLESGANVQVWTLDEADPFEQWELTHQGGGYYRIINAGSGMALDVKNGSSASRTNIQQYTWNGTSAQLWQLVPAWSGSYYFVPKCAVDRVMYVNGGYKKDGANLELLPCIGQDSEMFVLEPVRSELKITRQPEDVSVKAGETAEISIKAEGDGLAYQWQYRLAGKVTWFNSGLEGKDSDTLKVPATASRSGQSYRCVVTDSSGAKVESEAAVLTVTGTLKITKQPAAVAVTQGGTGVFSITAEGTSLSYQWQYCAAGASEWKNSGLEGCRTNTLKVPGLLYRNGQKYRCVVKDGSGSSVTSNAAAITVNAKTEILIITQPQDITAAEGSTAAFTVKVSGTQLSYQWQYRLPGKTAWYNSGLEGRQTASLKVPVKAGRNGQSYRCVITDISGSTVETKAATLTVEPAQLLEITKQPDDITAPAGEDAVFTLAAAGSGLSYQWQYRPAGKTAWTNSGLAGSNTAVLTVPVKASRDGQSYRCVVTDAYGNTVTSDEAVLLVGEALVGDSEWEPDTEEEIIWIEPDAEYDASYDGEEWTFEEEQDDDSDIWFEDEVFDVSGEEEEWYEESGIVGDTDEWEDDVIIFGDSYEDEVVIID